jgi:hypothetical protein
MSSRFKISAHAFMVALLMAHLTVVTAAPFYKCTINGSVTYQDDPCPSGAAKKEITAEQLNAQQQKKLGEMGAGPSGASSPSQGIQRPPIPVVVPGKSDSFQRDRPQASDTRVEPVVNLFRCDGRKYCSQMTSCAEAEYFLANCPGVKMDGNGHGNGVPCERQWCGRDADKQPSGRRRK